MTIRYFLLKLSFERRNCDSFVRTDGPLSETDGALIQEEVILCFTLVIMKLVMSMFDIYAILDTIMGTMYPIDDQDKC